MAEQTVLLPRPTLGGESGTGEGEWIVIVFNNEVNTWDQVTGILQKATGCNAEEAEMETWEIHNLGRSIVHHAEKEECERVAEVISTIGIKVSVDEL